MGGDDNNVNNEEKNILATGTVMQATFNTIIFQYMLSEENIH